MRNKDIEATWNYHNGTKHPNGNLLDPFHQYYPTDRPMPFKEYVNRPTVKLPLNTTPSPLTLFDARTQSAAATEIIPDLDTLTRILFFSGGLTKKYAYPSGDIYMRAASCTGALYHIELYVVSAELPDLEAGVYHYNPKDQLLTCLQQGDYLHIIREACGSNPHITHAPLILIVTDIYEWNAVKYQAREYRHAYWDSGTILAHTLALCNSYQLPATTVLGFIDSKINSLLKLDTTKEFTLALVPIGYQQETPDNGAQTKDISENHVLKELELMNYPAIHAMHQASSLVDTQELQEWLKAVPPIEQPPITGKLYPIIHNQLEEQLCDPLEKIILRRGSTRKFSKEPITFEQLSGIFAFAFASHPIHFTKEATPSFLSVPYLIVNAVEGLPSGTYVYHPKLKQLELLKQGQYREMAEFLGLNQSLPGDASVTVFFSTNLTPILKRFGNRGYRIAQLEASILGGKFYLGAYGQNFGATGLTFFDDEVTQFFSPHAEGKSVMFMISLGKRAKGRFHPGKLELLF